jgi:hypothetical protein
MSSKPKSGRGRRRPGAGSAKYSGRDRSRQARINRVVVMLDNDDFETLEEIARKQKLPLGTAAYRIMARALRRHR